MKIYTILSAVFALLSAGPSYATTGISYHGRLLLPSGEAVKTSTQFKIQIRSPGNENCLMYEETTTRDLSQTDGVFSITIGDGTGARTDTMLWSLDKIFANRSKFTFTGDCAIGTEYTPNIADGRRLQVSFNDGSFAGWEDLPMQTIGYSPIAIEAIQVGGFKASHLLRVQDGAGVPQSVAALTPAYFTELVALAAGTSTTYLKAANDLTIPGKFTATEICIGADCKTAWPAGGGGGSGTVTDVTSANAYLAVENGTSTPQLTLNVGTGANTVAAGNDSRFTDARAPSGAAGGDLGGTYPNPSVGKMQGNAIASGTIPGADVGKVYRWDGTALTAAYLNFSDLRTVAGASQLPAACAVNEKMQWSVLTDAFTCEAIGLNANQITAGTIDAARLPASVSLWQAGAGSTVYYSAGNVGIGNASPSSKLHITEADDSWNSSIRMDRSWDSSTDYFQMMYDNDGLKIRTMDDGDDAANIIFKPLNSEAMRISQSGNVGIGTANPGAALHVMNAAAFENNTNNMNAPTFSFWKNRNYAATQDGDEFGYISFFGHDGTTSRRGAYIIAKGEGAPPAGSVPASLGLYTTASGDGDSTERLHITSDGKVGIGLSNPSEKLEVTGKVKATELCIGADCKAAWPSGAGDFLADGSVAMTGKFRALQGAWNNPSISFASSTNTGFFDGGGYIGFSGSGNLLGSWSSTVFRLNGSYSAYMYNVAGTTPATPAYGFNGATTTGIFWTNPGVGFAVAGAEVGRINATGMGIGTSAPNGKLDVKGSIVMTGATSGFTGFQPAAAAGSTVWTLPATDGAAGEVLKTDGAGNLGWVAAGGGGGSDNLGDHTATQNIILGTNWLSGDGNNEGIYILSDGKVGVGTATPGKLLDVNGDAYINGVLIGRGGGSTITNIVVGTSNLSAGAGGNGTAIGYGALQANNAGNNNSAVGSLVLGTNTSGNNNTGMGYQALNQSNGHQNTAIGGFAMSANTTGNNSTALGYMAMSGNTTGTENTAVGFFAMYGNTTANKNVGIGSNALYTNTAAGGNTAVGSDALYDYNNTTNGLFSFNTVVGYNSGRGLVTGLGNTIIGAQVTGLPPALFGNVIIADGYGNRRINVDDAGEVGIGNNDPQYKLHVTVGGAGAVAAFENATGTCTVTPNTSSLSCSSDIRLKKNIDDILGLDALNKIINLQAKTYEWKNGDGTRHIGYIAQEAEKIAPELVIEGENGYKQISYSGFVPLLSEAIKQVHKEQKRDIASVEAELTEVKKKNEDLESRLKKLEALLEKK